MGNLFGVFSPYVGWSSWGLNWSVVFMMGGILPSSFWLMGYPLMTMLSSVLEGLGREFKSLLSGFQQPGSLLVPSSVLVFIIFSNISGLLPYVFASTAHLSFTLSLALPLWLGQILLSMYRQPLWVLSHFVPEGAPMVLGPFMVLIEIISNIIRPLTLAVRLFANLTAGHILVVLLSSTCGGFSTFLGLSMLVLLFVLELAVCIIQGYVFSTLNILYFSESETKVMVLK
uniref:ATP synthase subunit a n=1 Tax=Tigriopus californicus TaxID=6832 RepID=A2T4Z1_TIGCA|nr:ATP synthase F0 subunit 6 [Tigriopus californicus]ABI33103.1 ATP synthase F0 subunit 6 [Tigriopus californicus]